MRSLIVPVGLALSLAMSPACGEEGGGGAQDTAGDDAMDARVGDGTSDASPDAAHDVAEVDDGGPAELPDVDADDGADVEADDGADGTPDAVDVEVDTDPDLDGGEVGPDGGEVAPICGDGVRQGDEECDDGEANSDEEPDACRTDCTLPRCGDGVRDQGETCDDGNTDETDACLSTCAPGPDLQKPAALGDVLITELMINPEAASDPAGEWIELHNPRDEDLSLHDCALHDEGNDQVILADAPDPVILPAGGYLVLGFEADPEQNGGAPVDVAYDGMLLDNLVDEVLLLCGDLLVDQVAWDADGWPVAAGVAMSRDPEADGAVGAAPEAWCGATDAYGDGDLGTPGAPNPPCPTTDVEVDLCRVVGEGERTVFDGLELPLVVELEEQGLTDLSPGVDEAPGLRVQAGVGPVDTTPDGTWTWAEAQPVTPWFDEDGVDGWAAAPVVEGVGTLHAAGRVSLDDGATWTLCDLPPGSEDGYQPGRAIRVIVEANPCHGISCEDPPARRCDDDGVTVRSFRLEGAACHLADGEPVCSYPEDLVGCAAEGQVCLEDATCGGSAKPLTEPGIVLFSEFMAAPGVGGEVSGQWIELTNVGPEPVDLQGCTVAIEDRAHTIVQPLVAGAGQAIVLGVSGSLPLNGIVFLDYVYGDDLLFESAGGTVSLTCEGDVVDAFTCEPGGWPVSTGASTSLSPYALSAADNDAPGAWCSGQAVFGAGDLGTPGAPNPPCPGDENPVDACFVAPPLDVDAPAGTAFEARLLLHEEGVTDLSLGTDEGERLRVLVGHGPAGSPPGDGWTWDEAVPDGDWNATEAGAPADRDAWIGPLTVPAPGAWDVAFRVSADGGRTWTNCDGDEETVTYDPEAALRLTATESPCQPDPCDPEPPPGCDGDWIVERIAPATCSVDDGEALCSYPEDPVEDCGLLGGTCEGGACTDLPPPPALGQVRVTEALVAPASGPQGEWIELANGTGDTALDLAECSLSSGEGEAWSFPADSGPVLLEPGEHVVLARSAGSLEGGGTPDFVYDGALALDDGADEVRLDCGDAFVDGVAWDVETGWPVIVGVTLALSGNRLEAGPSVDPNHWCRGDRTSGVGTPGVPNPICPPPDPHVDQCWFQGPLAASVTATESLEVAGLLRDEGTTDATRGTDPAPGVRCQVGWGPDEGDPTDGEGGFVWAEAAPDTDWIDPLDQGDRDRWIGTVAPDAVGVRDLVVRFSVDDGASWTVCDRDGAANGYDPALVGDLTVEPSACIPSPCDAPPDFTCGGDLLTVGSGEATCQPPAEGEEAGPSCAYEKIAFDCGPYGGCEEGACVELPPMATGDSGLLFTEIMRDSPHPPPDRGEWVELRNEGEAAVDLRGCILGDLGDEAHVIDSLLPIVVPPGEEIVLAASADPEVLGGFEPDYVWSGVRLDNVFDELVLTCGEDRVDEVMWSTTWPGAKGVAMQLDPAFDTPDANDDPAAWCDAEEPVGVDEALLGTPGAPNHACP